jgi:putative endonuclease
MQRGGYIYILTNKNHTVLYVGVTSQLATRVHEHKSKKDPKSFAAKYNVDKLVYFESHFRIEEAINREKQIKAGNRKKKIALIESLNPEWKDLYDSILGDHW